MIHNYSTKYKNIELKPLEKKDIFKLKDWRNDTKNSKYLSKLPHITDEMQIKWFNNYLKDDNEIIFSINEIIDLQRVVGSISVYNFDGNTCEVGKLMVGDNEAHNKKIGYNSMIALLNLIFDNMKYTTVYLYVFQNNIPALKIYKKIGFKIKEINEKKQREILMVFNKGDLINEQ